MFGKPGQTIDQYVLLMLIRGDGPSELWLAREGFPGGREVLVKVFPTDYPGCPYFKRETTAIGKLDPRFVIPLQTSGYAIDCDYIVMELVAWRTLREMIHESRDGLNLESAMPVFTGILDALDHMHSRQVFHRDLKPDNIYLMQDGQVKIVDFVYAGINSSELVAMKMGEEGNAVVGAPVYMPPEQIDGGQSEDNRTDLYHFGVVMYETLTGHPPFNGQSVDGLIKSHLSARPPSLAQARPDLPASLDSFYRRLLAKKKENRFQTAREAKEALLRAARGEMIAVVEEEIEPVAPPSRPQPGAAKFCVHCGARLAEDETGNELCRHCGGEISSLLPSVSCSVCGARRPDEGMFCPHCGFQKTVPVIERQEPPDQFSFAASEPVEAKAPPVIEAAAVGEAKIDEQPDIYTSAPSVAPCVAPSPAPEAAAFEPGATINGRYRVEKLLGASGVASIYLVTDSLSQLHKELALKIPASDQDPDALAERLGRQFEAWKSLSDAEPRSVVRLLGIERVGPAAGIFMEYMPGGSLASMVADRWGGHPRARLHLAQLMRLFLQACESIRLLHAAGFLHRDIKPVNFLLDSSGTVCKMSDFELVAGVERSEPGEVAGTPVYMAPECFDGQYTVSTDIFALGVTLYQLLCGAFPYRLESNRPAMNARPVSPSEINPVVPDELSRIVMRCLEARSEDRPATMDEIIEDIRRLGLTEERANTAPHTLARLLLAHLGEEDIDYLARSLESSSNRMSREERAFNRAEMIEEYCYTSPPDEVLAQNCTVRQLASMASSLGIEADSAANREELIGAILFAAGFLPGPRQVPGVEATLSYLQEQMIELASATTTDECLGIMHSSFASVERALSWLVRFYGNLLYGAGFERFLSRSSRDAEPLTLGEKVQALKAMCQSRPDGLLPERVKEAFQWPLISEGVFNRLDELAGDRSRLANTGDLGGLQGTQRLGRKAIAAAIEVMEELAKNPYAPRVIQIVSRQEDVYGRQSFTGQDDRGRSERLFTPLPLEVGQMYLFYPLTDTARINPLIFPFERKRQ